MEQAPKVNNPAPIPQSIFDLHFKFVFHQSDPVAFFCISEAVPLH